MHPQVDTHFAQLALCAYNGQSAVLCVLELHHQSHDVYRYLGAN
ncbi:unnamed protein product [Schistosoma margrebowiei]|uniref:Uncharacterized protein n=1 Tax=Schistosoma margrebowiei TaxID=48269 RepID=A0A3P7ZM72_9TREM|nr:unnamed protein product [Schistosoma margrebowiei]